MTPSGGALAGYAEGAQKIVAARDTLNGIATDFTTQVNAIQAQGRDLDGNPGAALVDGRATLRLQAAPEYGQIAPGSAELDIGRATFFQQDEIMRRDIHREKYFQCTQHQ